MRIIPSSEVNATLLDDDMSVGRVEAKMGLKKMLESYKESCLAEMNAKIKKFTEECEEETKGMINEATSEAQSIWSAIVDLEVKKKAEEAQKIQAETQKQKGEEKEAVQEPKEKEEEKSEEAKSLSVSTSNWKWKKNEEGDALRGQNKLGSRSKKAEKVDYKVKNTTLFGDSLFALDEEEVKEARESGSSSFAGEQMRESSEDSVVLNESATGLLPSTKKLLGKDEEEENKEKDNKIVMAHSVPVAIPSVWGRRKGEALPAALASNGEDSDGTFERPDIIAANTWQDQVRMEWVEQSQKKLQRRATTTSADDVNSDDLDFLVSTHHSNQIGKK